MECLVISHTTFRIAVLPYYEGKSDVSHNDFPHPSSELCVISHELLPFWTAKCQKLPESLVTNGTKPRCHTNGDIT